MKKLTRRKFIKSGLIGAIGLVLLDAFWFEKYVIDWSYHDRSKPDTDKIKIIQLSDLHLNKIKNYHKSIARKINKIKPDLLFFTGDAIDKKGNGFLLNEFLELIDDEIRKYAILGNWEYWGDVDLVELSEIYEKHKCKLLINENRTVIIRGRNVCIIGVDDFVGGSANFIKSIQYLKKSDTTIVLSHCPAYRDVISNENDSLNLDLILSGHTHGGQISFFGYAPMKPPGSGRYLKGWYDEGQPSMYVSKGIGTSILPIRFGARAEVVEIDL